MKIYIEKDIIKLLDNKKSNKNIETEFNSVPEYKVLEQNQKPKKSKKRI